MVSIKEDRINFDKLEAELNAAVDSDERYQRENDAKFRAVHQKVATYEEFRDIVLASHIKPLEKGDRLQDERFKQQWNVSAAGGGQAEGQLQSNEVFTKKKIDSVPKNDHEFTKEWRRCCKTSEDKSAYLLELGAGNLGVIFKAEVGFGLLGDFIEALNEQLKSTDCGQVLAILEQLSKTNRFKLNLDFLSTREQTACKQLFGKLAELVSGEGKQSEGGEVGESAQTVLSRVQKEYGVCSG